MSYSIFNTLLIVLANADKSAPANVFELTDDVSYCHCSFHSNTVQTNIQEKETRDNMILPLLIEFVQAWTAFSSSQRYALQSNINVAITVTTYSLHPPFEHVHMLVMIALCNSLRLQECMRLMFRELNEIQIGMMNLDRFTVSKGGSTNILWCNIAFVGNSFPNYQVIETKYRREIQMKVVGDIGQCVKE